MGLPVWRAPSPPQAASKDATKADATAPSRSPIRRRAPWQPSSRRHRPRSRSRSLSGPSGPHAYLHGPNYQTLLLGWESSTLPLPPVPEPANFVGGLRRDSADPHIAEPFSQPSEPRANGVNIFAPPPPPPLPPVPIPILAPWLTDEPAPYTTDFAPARNGPPRPLEPLLQLQHQRYPSASTRQRDGHAGDESDRSSHDAAAERSANERTQSSTRVPRLVRTSRVRSDGGSDNETSNNVGSRLSRHERLDGLGDRERSFSPDDDNWDTMLSTIAPDTQLPTAASSFTSAAASASFSNSASNTRSSSAASSRTHLTVPSRRGTPAFDASARPCITSEDSGSETEPDDLDFSQAMPLPLPPHLARPSRPSRRHGLLRNPHRLDSPPSSSHGVPIEASQLPRRRPPPPSRYEPIYPISAEREVPVPPRSQTQQPSHTRVPSPFPALESVADMAAAARDTRAVADLVTQNYAAVRRLREQSADDWSITDAAALEPIRAIIDRLAQRDDIPEDWWMSVGLTHSLGSRRRG